MWVARTTSIMGSLVTVTAIALYVHDTRASAVALGIALVARAFPILLAPLAGVLADRVDPRRLMILCDGGQAVTVGLIAVWLPPFPVFVGLLAVAGSFGTLFLPASKSAVPKLVERAQLGRANALLGTSRNVAVAVGPVVSAFVYQAAGARAAFGIDAISYLVSAVLLTRVPGLGSSRVAKRVGHELREGMAYLFGNRVARAVAFGLFFGIAFIALDNVALVFLVRDHLGGGASGVGVASSAFGVGMVVVPLLLLARRKQWAGTGLFVVGLVCSGAGMLAVGLAPTVVLAVTAYGFAGVGNGLENIGADVAVGEHVEQDKLGRVFGAVYAPLGLADVIASGASGWLVEATSPATVFVIAGSGGLVVAGLTAVLVRRPATGAA